MKRAVISTLAIALAGLACGTTKYTRAVRPNLKVEPTEERIARGGYLVNQVGLCGACHTPRVGDAASGGERADMFLAGGAAIEDKAFNFKLITPNITPDPETGIGAWNDDEIMRAMRDGIGRKGNLLRMMPAESFQYMSDEDTKAVVAYLRTVPPVKNKVDQSKGNVPWILNAVVKTGAMHHRPAMWVSAPEKSDKLAWGTYVASIASCRTGCHSEGMTGVEYKQHPLRGGLPMEIPGVGKVFVRNLSSDVETGLGKYSADQIKEAIKNGKRLDGKPMAPPMAWFIPHVSGLTDEDLDALVTYIKSVPPTRNKIPDRELYPDVKKNYGE